MPDRLAQIEKMLEQGMSEEEILKALAPPATTPYSRLEGGSAMGAQHIWPDRPAAGGLAGFAKRFMGIEDAVRQTPEEEAASLPIPFTEKRVKPATAAMGALDVASGVQLLRALPAFARNLLGEAAPGVFQKVTPQAMHFGTRTPPAPEPPVSALRFAPKPSAAPIEPPVERFPSPMKEWLAESTAGTPSPGAAGINPEFPFSSGELSYDLSQLVKQAAKRKRR